ncbi:MAG: hypothetical protein E7672_01285 [Ruminococcaceae bacterium]|nr:hypothetical protein [Oscillospiraceae bacterium]
MNMIEEEKIPSLICGFLDPICEDGDVVRGFLPETWRDGFASLRMTGGPDTVRSYVDGSGIIALTFEIRVRCEGEDVGDRLDVLEFYKKIADHVRGNMINLGGREGKIVVRSNASKSAVFSSGEEEYRAAYVLRYFRGNEN